MGNGFEQESIQDHCTGKDVDKAVDHPTHYNYSPLEVIEALKILGLDKDAYLWNAGKYICRYGHKEMDTEQAVKDLEKAVFYLQYKSDLIRDSMGMDRKFNVVKDIKIERVYK